MRLMHMVNAGMWALNAAVWALYAHSIPMAVASAGAMCSALFMWHQARFN